MSAAEAIRLRLVDCPPGSARLKEDVCVSRHRKANAKGAGFSERLSICHGCAIGAERVAAENPAGPKPAPIERTPHRPHEAALTTTRTKTCQHPGCGSQFTTTGRNAKYCEPHRASKFAQQRTKMRAEERKRIADELEERLGGNEVDEEPSDEDFDDYIDEIEQLPASDLGDEDLPATVLATPREVLELAGFDVEELVTPAGVLLRVPV